MGGCKLNEFRIEGIMWLLLPHWRYKRKERNRVQESISFIAVDGQYFLAKGVSWFSVSNRMEDH